MISINRNPLPRKIFFIGCFLFLLLISCANIFAQNPYQRIIRKLDTRELNIPSISGFAFSPVDSTFLIVSAAGNPKINTYSINNYKSTSIKLTTDIIDPINMTYDSKENSLLFYDSYSHELVEITIGPEGLLNSSSQKVTRFNFQQLGLNNIIGITSEVETGYLYLLDSAVPQIVRIIPDQDERFDIEKAIANQRISYISLNELNDKELQGIGINPNNGNIFVANSVEPILYEINNEKMIINVRELASINIKDIKSIVFAPSGDRTDDPAINSIYLFENNPSSGKDRIIELTLLEPKQPNFSNYIEEATYVNTIYASEWSPPSPDPAGAAYIPPSNTLLISDSEVNEIPHLFTGVNIFETTLSGDVIDTFGSTSFSEEPTGIAYNPTNGHIFISDDSNREVYEIDTGVDGILGTIDDIITSFDTRNFNSDDPEGIAFDTWQGYLFIADGVNAEIYEVAPGVNGIFDGIPPTGDDVLSQFDTYVMGLHDPEGVEFNPNTGNLYIVSGANDIVVEATTTGEVVEVFDIAFLNADSPAGLAYIPSSNNLYITDRGVDNNNDPNENDGRIYEINLGATTPSLTINNVEVNEGNSGTVDATFTVTLSPIADQTVTVDYATSDVTATAPQDYSAMIDNLSFAPGVTTQTIIVSVNGDELEEGDETFVIDLSNAVNALITDDQGMCTIIGDDGAQPIIASFQDGIGGYNGTRDTRIIADFPGTNYGSDSQLGSDGNPDESTLLYWDVTTIPQGSTIQSVDFTFNVTSTTSDEYEIYEMNRNWIESEATWNEYSSGQSWEVSGADGTTDRGGTVLGSITAPNTGVMTISLNASGIGLVQSWVDNPSSNYGFILLDYTNASDGLDLDSREESIVSNRPKIEVSYLPNVDQVLLETKIFLEGPYDTGTNEMTTNLKTLGYIPEISPYSENLRIVSPIPPDITDWVLVQLRETATGAAVTSKSALLRKDGRIVADDGTTAQIALDASEGLYYVVIKHRNHLAVMSTASVQLSSSSSTLYDFTTSTDQYYGTDAKQLDVNENVFGMYKGDANRSSFINTTDYLKIKGEIGLDGYYDGDCNLNGVGNTTDYLHVKPNVGKNSMVP